ncbi:CmcJ/NvfI family oxidoreductase [Paraburkholderia phenoliruptrix]|uniref:CmcJ/NvfI family oxidoreductase n=1 Tax=Paraburkholderia phenoliruptrix TaxID=252970 RepID=UPI002869E7A2|nr:CmcJ/NvfI family oxidoreductase [Paraburkholderia phenoliruptrix]WMY11044.1 CmcJ/NvfI family oxidoreductase [Paraburkholderia phenoliruptrix]
MTDDTTQSDRGMDSPSRSNLDHITGRVIFARQENDDTPEVPLPNQPVGAGHDIKVFDARPLIGELSLDREGFSLVEHETSVADIRDPEILRTVYLEEMIPFIQKQFNASWVVARRHGMYVRSSSVVTAEGGRGAGIRGTAGMAHIDYSAVAAPMAAGAECQLQGIPIRSYSRLMVIQAWRAFSPPPQDVPLGLCDGSTLADSDIVWRKHIANNRNEPGSTFITGFARYNPAQRWYYFSQMQPNELILFKGYDSEASCNSTPPHTGIQNLDAGPNANVRESVEARFFVYFD